MPSYESFKVEICHLRAAQTFHLDSPGHLLEYRLVGVLWIEFGQSIARAAWLTV